MTSWRGEWAYVCPCGACSMAPHDERGVAWRNLRMHESRHDDQQEHLRGEVLNLRTPENHRRWVLARLSRSHLAEAGEEA